MQHMHYLRIVDFFVTRDGSLTHVNVDVCVYSVIFEAHIEAVVD